MSLSDLINEGLKDKNINPKDYLFTDIKPTDETDCLFINGKKVGSLGNIVTITGKPKSRKTTFLQAFISSFISGNIIFNCECIRPENTNICLIDTEQSSADLYNGIQRIKKDSNIKKLPAFFKVYQNRPLQSFENRQFLETLILSDQKLKIVFIDGMLDFVADMNNIDEASTLLFLLQRLCFQNNILIICILHENKSSNFTLGHIGSFLERKSQSLLRVEKTESGSTLSSVYMRSDEDFYPVSIFYNYNTNSYKINQNHVRENIKTASELTLEELKKLCIALYSEVNFYSNIELLGALKTQFKAQSEYFKKKVIERLYDQNLIIKIEDKIYKK